MMFPCSPLDIECVTETGRGFPTPEKDKVIQIASVLTQQGIKERFYLYDDFPLSDVKLQRRILLRFHLSLTHPTFFLVQVLLIPSFKLFIHSIVVQRFQALRFVGLRRKKKCW